MVCLSVRDTAVGIPPALLTKVLEPFLPTREKGAGSGLGLNQVQGFCVQAGDSSRSKARSASGRQATAGGLRVLPKPTAPEEMLAELRAVLPVLAS